MKLERKQYGVVFVSLVVFILVEYIVENFVIHKDLTTKIGQMRYYWLKGETLKWTAFIGFLPAAFWNLRNS